MTLTIFAVIYARFSPRPDAKTSESNRTQLGMIRQFCAEKGYQIVEQFTDPDKSGDDIERPGIWQAIRRLRKGWVLVAHHPDRIWKSVLLSEMILREVRRRGAKIEFVDGGVIADDPQSNFVRQIMAATFEMMKKVQAAKTGSYIRYHQARGIAMSKDPPYGMKAGPSGVKKLRDGTIVPQRRWIECPEEQEIIKTVLKLRAKGLGDRAIATKLNAMGLKARGSKFFHTTVRRILKRNLTRLDPLTVPRPEDSEIAAAAAIEQAPRPYR